jgi:hypothetical protein
MDFAKRKADLAAAGEANIHFAALQQNAQVTMAGLETERVKVEALVARGILTPLQGEEQLAKLEQSRLPVLQEIANEMRAAAISPEQIQAAQDFQNQLTQLAAASDIWGKRIAELKGSIESGLTQAFSNFFTEGITGAKSLGDAFRSLAQGIVGALQQALAQMIATMIVMQLMKSVMGFFGGGVGSLGTIGSGGTSTGGGALPVGGAAGGPVRGPGTGTSDSIPARLSAGEWVVTAEEVKRPGVLQFLQDLHSFQTMQVRPMGRMRSFASGGLVEPSDRPGGKNSRADLTVGLDPELILKKLIASSEWDRVVVKTIGNNRKGVKGILR